MCLKRCARTMNAHFTGAGRMTANYLAFFWYLLSPSVPFREFWSGLTTNTPFGMSLLQIGRLDLSHTWSS